MYFYLTDHSLGMKKKHLSKSITDSLCKDEINEKNKRTKVMHALTATAISLKLEKK